MVPSFTPPPRFVWVPCSFWNILPVSSLFSSYMPPLRPFLCIQPTPSSVWSPPPSVPPSSVRRRATNPRLRPTNVLFWFPDPASHMQVCTPPRPVRLVVLGLGVGGGAKETPPPAVVLSPSSRRQASPASGQVHAYARRWLSLLILAVPAWC